MRYFMCLCLFVRAFLVDAQGDTVQLEAVSVFDDPIHLFTTGTGLKKLKIEGGESSLTEVLEGAGNLYFKSYGHHQLSTISFRGTGASHTSTLWHGIPVNYPTIGQMDFSQWPAWMLGSVQLQPGSGSALYGSGSIGGTVLLDSKVDLKQSDHDIRLRVDMGSFGYFSAGVDAVYGNPQFSGRTRAYGSVIQNDFPYSFNRRDYKQANAGSENYGVQQQLQLDAGNHRFVFDGMFTQNDRENQPTKGNSSNDFLETTNLRAAFTHQFEAPTYSVNSSVAFIKYLSIYNEVDETSSDQFSILSSYWTELTTNTSIRVGFNTNLFLADAMNYPDEFTDFQSAFFGSITTQPFEFWKATLNLRQSIYRDNYPFTPSVGQTFQLFYNEQHTIKINQQLGWGFRFPTLNDLHWVPGGNPDLKPERSLSGEAGLAWNYEKNQIEGGLGIRLYKTWARDFIVWQPGDFFWSPSNFQEVNITGLEIEGNGLIKLERMRFQMNASYAFTQSLNGTRSDGGNQLPYVPKHNASASIKGQLNRWTLLLSGNLTGLRYTSLDNDPFQSVDGFILMNMSLNKIFLVGGLEIEIGGTIKNLFYQDYENLINRAMPGRNYQIHLLFKI